MTRTHQKPYMDMSRPVRIATWNTLTMNKTGYPEATAHVFSRMEVKLAGLTEIRLTGNGELLLQDYSLMYSGGDQHVRGVALLAHNSIKHNLFSSGMPFQIGFSLLAFDTNEGTSRLLLRMLQQKSHQLKTRMSFIVSC